MFRQIVNIIPPSFRRRSVTAAVTILLRAVLNFFGIALLVPLLMLILDGEAIHSHRVLQHVYEICGFTDDNHFVVAVAVAVVAAIVLTAANGITYSDSIVTCRGDYISIITAVVWSSCCATTRRSSRAMSISYVSILSSAYCAP